MKAYKVGTEAGILLLKIRVLRRIMYSIMKVTAILHEVSTGNMHGAVIEGMVYDMILTSLHVYHNAA